MVATAIDTPRIGPEPVERYRSTETMLIGEGLNNSIERH